MKFLLEDEKKVPEVVRDYGDVVISHLNGTVFIKEPDDVKILICRNGDIYWTKDYQMHREDGPAAILKNGHKRWYRNGVLHNERGPAVVNATEYWIDGKRLEEEDWILKTFRKNKYRDRLKPNI